MVSWNTSMVASAPSWFQSQLSKAHSSQSSKIAIFMVLIPLVFFGLKWSLRWFDIVGYEIVLFGKGNHKRKPKEYHHHPDGVMEGNKSNIKSENQSE